MIEATVGLPLWNAKHIGWLCLESFSRQKNITFDWEMVVCEEQSNNMMGKENVEAFLPKLKEVRCVHINYIPIKNWIPLGHKWSAMAKNSNSESKMFVISSADSYSHPYRLVESYDLIVNRGYDWISCQVGPFYNIYTGLLSLYDRRKAYHPTGLNMSTKTSLIRKLIPFERNSGVDSLIYLQISKSLEGRFKRAVYETKNWIHGINTQGLNNISSSRAGYMKTQKKCFRLDHGMNIKDCIPKDVLERLNSCKKFCNKGFV